MTLDKKGKQVIVLLSFLLLSLLYIRFGDMNKPARGGLIFTDNELGVASVSELWSYDVDDYTLTDLALRDVDNDGKLEVAVGSNRLYMLNGEDGTELWNYTPGSFFDSPVIGDVNNDGILEVVASNDGDKLYAVNSEDGSHLWNVSISTPTPAALGDIDNDGMLEVVTGSFDNRIYAFEGGNGKQLWNYTTGNYVFASAALGDVDNDGKLEVVIGSRDKTMYALNGEDGSLVWAHQLLLSSSNIQDSAALGDIDGDNKLEVVFGSFDDHIYALNGEDGSELWNYTTGANIQGSTPALGDIDDDGKLEVVVGSYDNKIYALNGEDGTELWSYDTGDHIASSPALGNVDGDNQLEVVIGGYDGYVYALNGEDGSESWNYTLGGLGIITAPVLGDIDGDNLLEVIVIRRGWTYQFYDTIHALKPTPSGQYIGWQGASGDIMFERRRNYNYRPGQDDEESPDTFLLKVPESLIQYSDFNITWIGSDEVTPTEQLIYSYYLEGYDSGWSAWTSQTSKLYEFLANGTYIFHVRAKDNEDNIDPTPATVTFTVATPNWRRYAQMGDILLHRSLGPLFFFLNWTHAGMYLGEGKVAEARAPWDGGVDIYSIIDWDYPNDCKVILLNVTSASQELKQQASLWAKFQAERDFPLPFKGYDFNLLRKSADPSSSTWYCSELVWASYYNNGINLDDNDDLSDPVSPDDLNMSTHTKMIGSHIFPFFMISKQYLLAKAYCPVNLRIADPDGLIISKSISEINDTCYLEQDMNGDGTPDDAIGLPLLKYGKYTVEILEESGALPTDSFRLTVSLDNTTLTIAEDVLISELSGTLYVFYVDENGIYLAPPGEPTPRIGGYEVFYIIFSILGMITLVSLNRKRKEWYITFK